MSRFMVFVFEGIDGTGKSTVSKMVFDYYSSIFPGKVFLFSEPSDTGFGKRLRDILKYSDFNLNIFEQVLLFDADRSYFVRNVLLPVMKSDNIVIVDRSFISTYAYQILNVDDEDLRKLLVDITEFSTDGVFFDVVLFFDCDVEVSLSRRRERDNFESKGVGFLNRVRENYRKFLLGSHKKIGKVVIIDASKPLDEVYNDVLNVFREFVGDVV